MFNLQQLETLIRCVESGSFSAAARKLGKAQSAVSTTIANLEIDTGIEIFDRSTRVPSLTADGKMLYSHAVSLISHSANIKAMVTALSSGVENSVTLVTNDLLLTPELLSVINNFYEHFPHTELSIQIIDNQHIAQYVSQHESAVGLKIWDTTTPTDVDLGLVGYLPTSVVVAKSHQLTRQKVVKLEELSVYRQVVLAETGSPLDITLTSTLTRTNHINVLVSILEQGDAWGIVPDHLLNAQRGLAAIKLLAEEKKFLLHVDRVTRKNQCLGPAMAWLHQQCSKIYNLSRL